MPQSLRIRRLPTSESFTPKTALETLSEYKIGIYFAEDDSQLRARARELQEALKNTGFKGVVALYPNSSSVLKSLVPAPVNQVRYDAVAEEEASEALIELLQQADPGRTYSKLRSRSGTRAFLSIFLAPDTEGTPRIIPRPSPVPRPVLLSPAAKRRAGVQTVAGEGHIPKWLARRWVPLSYCSAQHDSCGSRS